VRVRNISFEKSVTARFTTDGWTTVSEAHAHYVRPAPDKWDLFAFTIPLGAVHPRTLLLAVRYTVPGTGEWWDNNGGADFRVVLAGATPSRPAPAPGFGVGGVNADVPPPRRALVGACRTDVVATKASAHPQSSLVATRPMMRGSSLQVLVE
jgi:hypothetical protein